MSVFDLISGCVCVDGEHGGVRGSGCHASDDALTPILTCECVQRMGRDEYAKERMAREEKRQPDIYSVKVGRHTLE